jgi:uncharacterized protein YdaU (DUF1376 family)
MTDNKVVSLDRTRCKPDAAIAAKPEPLPYLPYYVADWAHATVHFTLAERGAFISLIEFYWPPGSLPNDETKLARLLRATPDEWAAVAPAVLGMFEPLDGELHNAKLDELRAKAAAKREQATAASRKGVEARMRKSGQPPGQPNE